MALRRAVIRRTDGATRTVELGSAKCSITAAIRDLYPDFDVRFIWTLRLEIDGTQEKLLEIGDQFVDDHLNRPMKLFVSDVFTGASIEFS